MRGRVVGAAVAAAAAAVLAAGLVTAVGWEDEGGGTGAAGSAAARPTGGAAASPTRPSRAPSPSGTSDGTAAPAAPPTARAPGTPSAPRASMPPAGVDDDLVVRYRVEVRSADPALRDADDVVEATLSDPRGWSRAGFRLVRDDDASAPFVVVLAEPDDVDALCRPYDTDGRWSCQNGPVVALNADRWRAATSTWTGDLDTYRQMLVNHEVGHLLGQHHPPAPQCPTPGRPALVMSQQSTELDGCLPNPWPLPQEVRAAARHDEPLAPPYRPTP